MTHRYMSEVHRATQRRQREEEKCKQLLEWRERKMSIRRQVQDLVNMSLNSEEEEVIYGPETRGVCYVSVLLVMSSIANGSPHVGYHETATVS